MPRQDLNEREIRMLEDLLENPVKIPNRLVSVNYEDQMKLGQWAAPLRISTYHKICLVRLRLLQVCDRNAIFRQPRRVFLSCWPANMTV